MPTPGALLIQIDANPAHHRPESIQRPRSGPNRPKGTDGTNRIQLDKWVNWSRWGQIDLAGSIRDRSASMGQIGHPWAEAVALLYHGPGDSQGLTPT